MKELSLLEIRQLNVTVRRGCHYVPIVKDVDLEVPERRSVGLVGESGSGKTTVLRSVLGLLPPNVHLASGTVAFEGSELTSCSERQLRQVRGARIGVVWQDALAALDPVMRVGDQIAEVVRAHRSVDRQGAMESAKQLMRQVDLPEVERMYNAYPHQLSGGQRQRVVIASAIAAKPRLLLADEPTTALDVTVQDQVLALLEDLRSELGLALLIVTHDLAIVDQSCDIVAVMYAGRIVEDGPVREVFSSPRHHYTAALLRASPSIDRPGVLPKGVPGAAASEVALRGCAFASRCLEADAICFETTPELTGSTSHRAACHHRIETKEIAQAQARNE